MQREYKARNYWVSRVTHWELYKKFKFDHVSKLYMHNPEFVLENETNKILLGFEIQMDHIILARRPDLVIVNNKKITSRIVDFFRCG